MRPLGQALYTRTDHVIREYSTSVTNPKEKPHARPRHKWVNNIKTGLSEINITENFKMSSLQRLGANETLRTSIIHVY